ncbi:MAG: hypothetical protein MUC81_05885 [Bacteroidia bacterium]|jgi:hypothetical protein|nr:hypothetical protein [Bacteroidia bacterium]
MSNFKTPTILCLFLLFSSCSAILNKMVGLKSTKVLNDEEIIKAAKEFNIPEKHLYYVDTAYAYALKRIIKDTLQPTLNNHLQPLQALYFIQSDYPVSFQINCYAGGLPKLDWNRDGIMEAFPPKLQAPLDQAISGNFLLSLLKPVKGATYPTNVNSRNMVVVFWTRFMNKHTSLFIQTIQQNLSRANNPVEVIYINADNLYALVN